MIKNCGIIVSEGRQDMNYYDKNKAALKRYLKSGEKFTDEKYLGLEFEHIITEKDSLRSISYYEKDGIEEILKDLENSGWETAGENGRVLSAKKGKDTITLEPGGQFELSTDKAANLVDIETSYSDFIKDILPILEKRDRKMLAIGYHPVSRIEEIDYIPKERYGYMSDYLSKKDICGINMMKGTASIQATIDYFDEDDFIKKFRVANYLTVLFSVLFDNSPIFEGDLWRGNLARVHIWNHVDTDRSRIMPGSLDERFGYEDYAVYLLERPLVISLLDGEMIYTKDKPMKEVYRDKEMDQREVEHALSMFFPDVRVKKYIELRMCDSVPYPFNLSVGALVKGIFYAKDNLDFYFEKSMEATNESVQNIKDTIIRNEKIPNEVLEDIKILLEKAERGLAEDEKKYIKPLMRLFEESVNLARLIKSEYKSKGKEAFDRLKMIDIAQKNSYNINDEN